MYKLINTFGIDAKCAKLLEFTSVDELKAHYAEIAEARRNGKLLIIGRGSNLLPVGDYDGLVVRSRIMGRELVASDMICVGSGETVDDVIAWTLSQNLFGMENLSIIPGEVGASAVQNIGAYGVEIKDVLHSVKAVEISTGKIVTFQKDELEYAYRDSRFKHDLKSRYLIIEVSYLLYSSFTAQTSYGNISSYLLDKGIEIIDFEEDESEGFLSTLSLGIFLQLIFNIYL